MTSQYIHPIELKYSSCNSKDQYNNLDSKSFRLYCHNCPIYTVHEVIVPDIIYWTPISPSMIILHVYHGIVASPLGSCNRYVRGSISCITLLRCRQIISGYKTLGLALKRINTGLSPTSVICESLSLYHWR